MFQEVLQEVRLSLFQQDFAPLRLEVIRADLFVSPLLGQERMG